MIDLRTYEDTYRDLKDKRMTKLSFPMFMERMLRRNLLLRKQEFEDRRIKLRFFDVN
jgi:hypothetical protein